MREINGTPYLPFKAEYVEQLEEAGFGKVDWEDVSERWVLVTRDRAERYRHEVERIAELEVFYDNIAERLAHGNVGGVRVVATRF